MGIGREFIELMDDLGYSFRDLKILQTALTHSSYTNEMKTRGFRAESNESMEFLGDAVLQIFISEAIYSEFSKLGEGVLTDMRKRLVCKNTLARLAEELKIGEYINVGNGEEAQDIRRRPKVLANALEAVIGAMYIDDPDGGKADCRTAVLRIFKNELLGLTQRPNDDYKTALLQFVEKNGDSVLRYEYEEDGPEHKKLFRARVYVNNNLVGRGEGGTKREAEMGAAKEALGLFGII